jgi:peptidoglycan/xylan/chitin deacetylase (PgdA/CDA1 family)
VEAAHSIGIHTASHVYTSIYKSVEAYLQDFELAFRRVEQATGVRCDMFRFPGGSVNAYNRTIYQQIAAEMLRRGFTYYDWNASGDDSAGQTKADGITKRALETTTAQRAILLLHDNGGKDTTAKALPTIIDKLLDRGYRFDKLDSSVLPHTFTYKY